MSPLLLRVITFSVLIAAGAAEAQQPGGFELLGSYRGRGRVQPLVGAGPAPGSQRLYLSYLYTGNTLEVVAVDPDSGEFRVFANPAPSEWAARTMIAGPDGNIYLGTLPHAHFLKLDPKAGKLIDLGRPSETEEYIWEVAFGSDGKLYGATYPHSKLVRYDPASGKLEDLGRMDPVEQYAHYVAGSDDGYMYVGIGNSKANIAVYEIATGIHREILPEAHQIVGQARVHVGTDGKVYGMVGSQFFLLRRWTATPIQKDEVSPPKGKNRLVDGRVITVHQSTVRISDPKTGGVSEHAFSYQGRELPIFRLASGPDGKLYASSILPIHFLRLDPDNGIISELGEIGGGEVYSFLAARGRLLMAAYGGAAPLMAFTPEKPFQQVGSEKNPALVNFPGSDGGWRPQALIEGPDGRVYIGSVAGYGRVGGPLTVWNLSDDTVTSYPNLITDQSVVSLARWRDLIVGGTTISGGGGSHATQKEAKLFLWDPGSRRKLFETVPVAATTAITDLITAPNGRLVYGIAGPNLFAFDPAARKVTSIKPLPFRRPIYNSVAVGPDGRIWGLAADGIFVIDPATHEAALAARTPQRITGGFALHRNAIYFACGESVWRYALPQKTAE